MKPTALTLFALLALTTSSSHAGLLSRAKTEARRADVAEGGMVQPIRIDGLAIYSFLQDASGADKRLRKDNERFRLTLSKVFEARGARISSMDALAAGAELPSSSVVRRTSGPIETGSVKTLSEQAKASALELARSHQQQEQALPASHRLILLPEQLTHSTGMSWSWPRGAAVSGVNSYSFKVYWMVEDVAANQPIVTGATIGTLDIRGFPAQVMAEQIADELAKLQIAVAKP